MKLIFLLFLFVINQGGSKEGHGHGKAAPIDAHDIDGKLPPLSDAERAALLAPDIDDFDPDAGPVRDPESGRPAVYHDYRDGDIQMNKLSHNNKQQQQRGGKQQHGGEALLDLLDDDEQHDPVNNNNNNSNSYSDLPEETKSTTAEDLHV